MKIVGGLDSYTGIKIILNQIVFTMINVCRLLNFQKIFRYSVYYYDATKNVSAAIAELS